MSTSAESKPEPPPLPSREATEATAQKRAECEKRISQLLSSLYGGGPSLTNDNNGNVLKPAIQETKTDPEPARQPTHLQPDLTTTVTALEKEPPKSEALPKQPTVQPAETTGGGNPPKHSDSAPQELAKAADPADSRPNSLRQDGAPPANSVMRVAGKFFAAAARTITLNTNSRFAAHRYEFVVLGNASPKTAKGVASGNLTLTSANYETINIHYIS